MPRTTDLEEDPLSLAIAPPKNETPQQRQLREELEEQARQNSQRIDERIKAERLALKRARQQVKVLLLGQSHAGKSTVLKNFQIAYNREAWEEERVSWKAVIYLNLVRTVNNIVDILSEELAGSQPQSPTALPSSPTESTFRSPHRPSHTTLISDESKLSGKHRILLLRLGPFRRIQHDLQVQLGIASADSDSGYSSPYESDGPVHEAPPTAPKPLTENEFSVASNARWKGVLKSLQSARNSGDGQRLAAAKSKHRWLRNITDIIGSCKEDIKTLWKDPIVRGILDERQTRVEDTSGFFLDDVDRLASSDYEPSDFDVVRARLKTNGVQEYHFKLDKDHDWIFYDFCGSRSYRSAWVPYFDDVQAIIFLAPLSPFDEYEQLPDGSHVNRLHDSFQMWRSICSSKLLAHVQLILFLNKCDQLKRRLKHNVMVKEHIQSFKDRSNDYKTVSNYFRSYFKEIQRKCSPAPREFFAHFTTAVDTASTLLTLSAVREAILMNQLRDSDFL
ncbi:G-alpha-domain-containing protein [Pluteus cervinus]|uniref:G-alpha-domain-containing protein n=1 Tax=Pluteus cervinus TaxID=181527 RepID=A0ACD3B967_9AGAR|nr:G-alpha-domain-containing protein [Pluteus cervinus]